MQKEKKGRKRPNILSRQSIENKNLTEIDGSSADQNFKTFKAKSCAKSACGRRKKEKKKKRNIFLLFETSTTHMAGWRVRGKPLTHCLHVVWKEMSAPWNRQARDAFCSAHSLCSEEPQQHILRAQRRLSAVMAFYLSGMTERMIRNVCRVYTHYVREPRCIYLFILIILFFYPSARPSSHLSRRSLSACHFQCSWYF